MILEVVDKMCIAAMKVASIIDMIDCRLHLQYEGGEQRLSTIYCYRYIVCSIEKKCDRVLNNMHHVHASDVKKFTFTPI